MFRGRDKANLHVTAARSSHSHEVLLGVIESAQNYRSKLEGDLNVICGIYDSCRKNHVMKIFNTESSSINRGRA